MEAFYFMCIQLLNAHIYICSCLLKNYIIFDFAFRIFDQFNFIKKETCACINPLEKCWQILLQQICNIVHFQNYFILDMSSMFKVFYTAMHHIAFDFGPIATRQNSACSYVRRVFSCALEFAHSFCSWNASRCTCSPRRLDACMMHTLLEFVS